MGSPGSVSYPFVTLGLGEGSGQAQLGDKRQGLPDGQVGEQLVVLAHVGYRLPHQLRCAGLLVDPDLAGLNLAAMASPGDHIQHRGSPTTCKATRDVPEVRFYGASLEATAACTLSNYLCCSVLSSCPSSWSSRPFAHNQLEHLGVLEAQ